ncbi:MAG: hypothetical protein LBG84_06165 [Treponema sp.]|nr:hypothetical protein [Treponema sp.]
MALGLLPLGIVSCMNPLDVKAPAEEEAVQYDAQGRRLLVIRTATGGGGGPPGP